MATNILTRVIDNGLRSIESMLGGPVVVFKGQEIPCVVSTERSGTVLEVGGMAQEVDTTIIIRKSALSEMTESLTIDSTLVLIDSSQYTIDATGTSGGTPHPGKAVIRSGKRLRILTVRDAATNSHYALDCASAKR